MGEDWRERLVCRVWSHFWGAVSEGCERGRGMDRDLEGRETQQLLLGKTLAELDRYICAIDFVFEC
jgi:hypothetical protein